METSNFKFSKEHTWINKNTASSYKVGISDFAQEQLGEIIFVELPDIESSFEQGEAFGVVESAKSVSELYMPISGTIAQINSKIEDEPDIINKDPYEQGWMIEIQTEGESGVEQLLSKGGYEDYISS